MILFHCHCLDFIWSLHSKTVIEKDWMFHNHYGDQHASGWLSSRTYIHIYDYFLSVCNLAGQKIIIHANSRAWNFMRSWVHFDILQIKLFSRVDIEKYFKKRCFRINWLIHLIQHYNHSDYISVQTILILTLQVVLAKEEFRTFSKFLCLRNYFLTHPYS